MIQPDIVTIQCQDRPLQTLLDDALLSCRSVQFLDSPRSDVIIYLKALRNLAPCGPTPTMLAIDKVLQPNEESKTKNAASLLEVN